MPHHTPEHTCTVVSECEYQFQFHLNWDVISCACYYACACLDHFYDVYDIQQYCTSYLLNLISPSSNVFERNKPPEGFKKGFTVCNLQVKFKDIYNALRPTTLDRMLVHLTRSEGQETMWSKVSCLRTEQQGLSHNLTQIKVLAPLPPCLYIVSKISQNNLYFPRIWKRSQKKKFLMWIRNWFWNWTSQLVINRQRSR